MKAKFSKAWIASKQPRKQRKYLANAPLHILGRMAASTLSKELRKKHGIRSIQLRKGDSVKIMVGKFKKKEGKVEKINLKKMKVYIAGVQAQRRDGTKVNVPIHPSNLQIKELNLDDKKRLGARKATNAKENKENKENAPEKK